jgi:hypothetical protein
VNLKKIVDVVLYHLYSPLKCALNKHIKKYVPESKNDIKKNPNAVNYLGEEPDLFYCAMWISSEQNDKQEENIEVSDPFNIYDDTYWLRNNILKAQKVFF